MAGRELRERRRRPGAGVHDKRTARGEAAAGRRVRHVRHHALDGGEMVGSAVEPRDRAEQADRVGMLRARRTARRPAARSTISPAYITATSSQTSATTPRSCVIRMMAAPLAAFSSRIRSRICACRVTSSAVVGSSAISSVGSQASAIAIITRWRMPPESLCGYSSMRFSGEGMCTRRKQLDGAVARGAARAAAVAQDRLDDLVADGEARIERGHRLLEDHGEPVAAQVAQRLVGRVQEIEAVEADRAGDLGRLLRAAAP